MGCYGIGVSRTLAALYEQYIVKNPKGESCGFVLPEMIAPYMLQIIPKLENEEKKKLAEELYKRLNDLGLGAILDDRETITIGAKIKDAKILGTPYIAVLGDKTEGEIIEIENNLTGEKTSGTIEEIVKILVTKKLKIQ